MKTNKYITKEFIGNDYSDNVHSEIDYDLQDFFGFNYLKYNQLIMINKNKDEGNADAHVIKINDLINALDQLQNKGANFVELEYNSDHIGYNIAGYKITDSTEEEIDLYKKSLIEKQNQENLKKIKYHEDEIRKIKSNL